MPPPHYAPAPVLEIVSFGYRKLFENIKPFTLLALPLILFSAIVSGFFYEEIFQLQPNKPMTPDSILSGGAVGLASLVMSYFLFAAIRYIRDGYHEERCESLYDYLKPNRLLLGLLGLFLLNILLFIPLFIPIFGLLLGLFFMGQTTPQTIAAGVVLGLGVVTLLMVGVIYLSIRLMMIYVVYTDNPDIGVIGAYKASWVLTRNNFWRTLGLSLLVTLIQAILGFPVGVIQGILTAILKVFPEVAQGVFFIPVAMGFMVLQFWVHYVLGMGGALFVNFRYLYDLQARAALPAPETT